MQKYQRDTRNDPNAIKHRTRPQGTIPVVNDELDYYDRKFVEDYVCSRLSVRFHSVTRFDAIGSNPWNERLDFKFKCELLLIVTGFMRVHFWLPYTDPSIRGNFTNDSGYGDGR